MGSWNATCLLSNLPIIYNEPIKLIPLVKKEERELNYIGSVYPNDTWEPMWMVLEGRYNDYGSICDVQQNSFTKKLFEVLRQLKKDTRLSIASDHYDLKGDFDTIEEFFSFAERARIYLYERIVGFALCRADAWDALVKMYPVRKSDEDDGFALLTKMEFGTLLCGRVFAQEEDISLFDRLERLGDAEKIQPEECKVQNEFYAIHSAMCYLRKSYSCEPGASSQHINFGDFKKYYDEMGEIASKCQKIYNRD